MKDDLKLKWLWWLLIIAMLGLFTGLVSSMAKAMTPDHQCMVGMVDWALPDSTPVQSFGCLDMHGDTLVIIPHLVNGEAKDALGVLKKDVKKITALKPAESATFKPRQGT